MKENCFFLKKFLTPSCSLCKLYHKADSHIFGEYKRNKLLWNHLETTTILKVRVPFLRFSKNTLTHSEKRPAMAAIIHKNLTLTMFLTSKESLPTGNLLKHNWNIHFNTWCILLRERKFKQYLQDTVNPLYSRSLEGALTSHFFLRCQNLTNLKISWNN